jgi:hypothetical protein
MTGGYLKAVPMLYCWLANYWIRSTAALNKMMKKKILSVPAANRTPISSFY